MEETDSTYEVHFMADKTSRATLAPRLRFQRPTDLDDVAATLLGDHTSRDSERYADADLTGGDLTASRFSGCEFSAITWTETELRSCHFAETLISDSYASILPAPRTTWHDVLIERPRWGSAELFDSELNSVHILGGKIDFLNLRNARLDDVLIEGAMIGELDFGSAKLNRVAFTGCRIGLLDLNRATCADVDLRGADFAGIAGIEGLRGATVDDLQLSLLGPLFAAHIGLKIE